MNNPVLLIGRANFKAATCTAKTATLARAGIDLNSHELARLRLDVDIQRRFQAAIIDQILLSRLREAPVGRCWRRNVTKLVCVSSSRRFGTEQLVVRL